MKLFRIIAAVLTVIISVATVLAGVSLMKTEADHSIVEESFRYAGNEYDAEYASFGGDFYTYVYKASDIIVSELSDINNAIGTVVKAQNATYEAVGTEIEAIDDLIDTVSKVGGMIVAAIGLMIFAQGIRAFGEAISSGTVAVKSNDQQPAASEAV